MKIHFHLLILLSISLLTGCVNKGNVVPQGASPKNTLQPALIGSNQNTIFYREYGAYQIYKVLSGEDQGCYAGYQPSTNETSFNVVVWGPNSPFSDAKFGIIITDKSLSYLDSQQLSADMSFGQSKYKNTPVIGIQQSLLTLIYKSKLVFLDIEMNQKFQLSGIKNYTFSLPVTYGLMAELHRCAGVVYNPPNNEPSLENKVQEILERKVSKQSHSNRNSSSSASDVSIRTWKNEEVVPVQITGVFSTNEIKQWSSAKWRGVTKTAVGDFTGPVPFIEFSKRPDNHIQLGSFVQAEWIKSEWLAIGGPLNGNGVGMHVPIKDKIYSINDFFNNEKNRCDGKWSNLGDVQNLGPQGAVVRWVGGECYRSHKQDSSYRSSFVLTIEPVDHESIIVFVGRREGNRSQR